MIGGIVYDSIIDSIIYGTHTHTHTNRDCFSFSWWERTHLAAKRGEKWTRLTTFDLLVVSLLIYMCDLVMTNWVNLQPYFSLPSIWQQSRPCFHEGTRVEEGCKPGEDRTLSYTYSTRSPKAFGHLGLRATLTAFRSFWSVIAINSTPENHISRKVFYVNRTSREGCMKTSQLGDLHRDLVGKACRNEMPYSFHSRCFARNKPVIGCNPQIVQ